MIPLHMIPDALRAEDVFRYHMVRTMRRQNLAEHSFNVAVIASAIAEAVGCSKEEINQIAYNAMLHDLDEVFTGDVPSHTKAALRARGTDWTVLEGNFPSDETKNSNWIVKIADLLESIRFLTWCGEGAHAATVLEAQKSEFEKHLGRRSIDQMAIIGQLYNAICTPSVSIGSEKWKDKK